MKIVAKALIRDATGNILLLQRSLTHPNFPQHIDFPGGEVETNESHIEAVQREIKEETGFNVPLEELELAYLEQPSDNLTHVVYLACIQEAKPKAKLSWEHDGFEWVQLDKFIATPLPENADIYHLTVLNYINQKSNN